MHRGNRKRYSTLCEDKNDEVAQFLWIFQMICSKGVLRAIKEIVCRMLFYSLMQLQSTRVLSYRDCVFNLLV